MPKVSRGGKLNLKGSQGPSQQAESDPVSDALGPQGAPMTYQEAIAHANDMYITRSKAYTQNCQRCVWAVEARMRGYDVEALPRTSDDSYAKCDPNVPNSFLNVSKTPIQLESFGNYWQNATATEVKGAMLQHGVGARGMLVMNGYKSGHVLNWEVQGPKKVAIFDGQSNKTYTMTELKKYFVRFRVGRIDNVEFTPLIKDYVKPR